jgi:hypothetical protein
VKGKKQKVSCIIVHCANVHEIEHVKSKVNIHWHYVYSLRYYNIIYKGGNGNSCCEKRVIVLNGGKSGILQQERDIISIGLL